MMMYNLNEYRFTVIARPLYEGCICKLDSRNRNFCELELFVVDALVRCGVSIHLYLAGRIKD